MLNKECPTTKDRNINVFFTDAFEIREDGQDKTTEALTQVYAYAATLDDFCCDQTTAVTCGDWEKQYGTILNTFNENRARLPKDGGYK